VFGGAALEKFALPPRSSSVSGVRIAPPPVTPDDHVPVEPVEEPPTPFTDLASPHSTPPTAPPAGVSPPPPKPLAAPQTTPPARATPLGKLTPPKIEDSFFQDTEGKQSQPMSVENALPRSGLERALPFVIVLGLVLGIGGTLAFFNRPTVTVLDAGTELAEVAVDAGPTDEAFDAGGDEAVLTEVVEDAGAVMVAPVIDAGQTIDAAVIVVDAGHAVIDAGGAALDAGRAVVDAGAVAVIDAGRAVIDAGAGAVDAGKPSVDAGKPVVVDAGQPMVAAVVDAGSPSKASDDTLLNDARAALVARRYRDGITLFRKVLKTTPESLEARTGLGISLVMADVGYAEAVPYLRAAVKADPKNALAWLALGIAADNLGRNADAKDAWQTYLTLVPTGLKANEVREALRLMK
jgi:hypothetical protein